MEQAGRSTELDWAEEGAGLSHTLSGYRKCDFPNGSHIGGLGNEPKCASHAEEKTCGKLVIIIGS